MGVPWETRPLEGCHECFTSEQGRAWHWQHPVTVAVAHLLFHLAPSPLAPHSSPSPSTHAAAWALLPSHISPCMVSPSPAVAPLRALPVQGHPRHASLKKWEACCKVAPTSSWSPLENGPTQCRAGCPRPGEWLGLQPGRKGWGKREGGKQWNGKEERKREDGRHTHAAPRRWQQGGMGQREGGDTNVAPPELVALCHRTSHSAPRPGLQAPPCPRHTQLLPLSDCWASPSHS